MRVFNEIFALLVALAVTATALRNPHERAAKLAKRKVSPVYTRNAPKTNFTSLFLNEKSKSKFAQFPMEISANPARIRRQWQRTTGNRLQPWRVICWLASNQLECE
jgi:hypothetical protein